MKVYIFIPARLESQRFSKKVLAKAFDKPLIQWVYERALLCKFAEKPIIATDSQEVFDAAKSFGGECIITSSEHKSGTTRIAEAINTLPNITDVDVIINWQGDEPLVNPQDIFSLVQPFEKNDFLNMATLMFPIFEEFDFRNPNVVKVVADKNMRACYFSRSPIPYSKTFESGQFFKHIGIYAYRADFLQKYVQFSQTDLERAENLEQLRAIYMGESIQLVIAKSNQIGIDTTEDFENFKNMLKNT